MQKKHILILFVVLLLTSGCTKLIPSITGSPESTAEDFVEKVIDGDTDEAAEMMVTEDLEPYPGSQISIYKVIGATVPNFIDTDSLRISAEGKIELTEKQLSELGVNKGYKVDVAISNEDESFTVTVGIEVVPVNGKWKVLHRS